MDCNWRKVLEKRIRGSYNCNLQRTQAFTSLLVYSLMVFLILKPAAYRRLLVELRAQVFMHEVCAS